MNHIFSLSKPLVNFSHLSIRAANSSYRHFTRLAYKNIPGLIYIPDFLNEKSQQDLLKHSLILQSKIAEISTSASAYKSKSHNLNKDRFYKLLNLQDLPGRKINAQRFEDYGDTGHELTYFMHNHNIPAFIQELLIPRIEELDVVKKLKLYTAAQLQPFDWRFTFNIYNYSHARQPGFDWHTDIPANGDITSITTLLSSTDFELRKQSEPEITYSVPLSPGSIVLLSEEVRWGWEHRVVPQAHDFTVPQNMISRISLVLGCKRDEGQAQIREAFYPLNKRSSISNPDLAIYRLFQSF